MKGILYPDILMQMSHKHTLLDNLITAGFVLLDHYHYFTSLLLESVDTEMFRSRRDLSLLTCYNPVIKILYSTYYFTVNKFCKFQFFNKFAKL